ncbi:MAG: MetQ/NlpA family ABC transporter substrate-binding protein [Eubacteriales bacterium]|nr:MetQ/NlpA family ABC transporter substrate-binding protein [Eubacteriales bacterium]
MKKLLFIALSFLLAVSLLAGCAGDKRENSDAQGEAPDLKKIVIGASTTPHAEILKVAAENLKEKGYELEIIEFDDYVQPNLALDSGQLDANFFQHKPYLDDFNAEKKTNIVSAAAIHYEPLGIYVGKTMRFEDLKEGAIIAVPNDTTNEARALLLLEENGLITIKEGAGLQATVKDIAENPKKLEIKEIEAAQVPRALPDVDLGVINGNYAIKAGLDIEKDAIAKEEADSLAAETYANIIAVRAGDENRDDIKALVDAVKSDNVKQYIKTQYKGSVVALD